jgi:hypothetical protein
MGLGLLKSRLLIPRPWMKGSTKPNHLYTLAPSAMSISKNDNDNSNGVVNTN